VALACVVLRSPARSTLERERMVLGWPKRCKLAHAFLWEYSYKKLKLDQLLGQLGVFLTWRSRGPAAAASLSPPRSGRRAPRRTLR
jgi:hypothetical protein